MKPRSFGQLFGSAAALTGGGWFLLSYLLYDNYQLLGAALRFGTDPVTVRLIVAAIFGIPMGLLAAYQYRGETISREPKDQKTLLNTITVRLAESGYNIESQTEALVTFKPPFNRWLGGRVYVLPEGKMLRIVGPASVLKKLRDV